MFYFINRALLKLVKKYKIPHDVEMVWKMKNVNAQFIDSTLFYYCRQLSLISAVESALSLSN